jgi:hypothetical protein
MAKGFCLLTNAVSNQQTRAEKEGVKRWCPFNTEIQALFIDGECDYYTIFRNVSCKFQSTGIMGRSLMSEACTLIIDLVGCHVAEEVESPCVARVAFLVEVVDPA